MKSIRILYCREDQSSDNLVLVTGATGYLAAHVIKQLQEAGHRVRGTVRSLKNEAKVKPIRELCPEAAHPIELVEADLLDADSWPKAVEGCTYVIHTASPFPWGPAEEEPLVKVAVGGTVNVLQAVKASGSVRRVVLTSSTAAITGGSSKPGAQYSEQDFPDPNETPMDPYCASKAMAERTAWDLARNTDFELCVVNPSFVFGPPLHCGAGASNDIIKGLMTGKQEVIQTRIQCVDVRDVARAHVAAMTTKEAAGHRHCLVTESLWFADLAKVLHEEFAGQGYNVTKWVEPPNEEMPHFDTRMSRVVTSQPISIRQSVIEMAHRLIEIGQLPKTDKYRGLNNSIAMV